MAASSIELTGATWNPVVCCTTNKHVNGVIALRLDKLREPLKWKKPRRVFVNSTIDLFHDDVPDEFIDKVFAVMASCGNHTFQVLTKRPQRMAAWFARVGSKGGEHANLYQSSLIDYYSRHGVDMSQRWQTPTRPTPELRFIYDSACGVDPYSRIEDRPSKVFAQCHWRNWPLSNVWLGVSVEDQQHADERIPLLLQTPAAVRFISCEPLLGPIDIHHSIGLTGPDWIICGGESGPDARPMHPDWARSIRDQCQAAGVPFFFKQIGEWQWGYAPGKKEMVMYADGRFCDFTKELMIAEEKRSGKLHDNKTATIIARVGKKSAGRLLDGREWNEFPEDLRVREYPEVK